MSFPSPFDAKITSTLIAAAKAARQCDPDDTHKSLELVKQLKELEVHLEHSPHKAMSLPCQIALRITENVVRRLDSKPGELLPWVTDLIEHIARTLQVDVSETARPARGRQLSETGFNTRLSLVDGQRLGEILVRMSFLRRQDVERALELQKKKGLQLGDALVELELLSRDELDAALRVQKQKRTRELDPWMDSWGRKDKDEPAPKRKPRSA